MTKEMFRGIVVLRADEGMFITNGEICTDSAYLGKNANESDWRDATAEEYAEWLRQQEAGADETAGAVDEPVPQDRAESSAGAESKLDNLPGIH